jgi:hypothetical protein
VIETEPLELNTVSASNGGVARSHAADDIFLDVPFWKTLGEEYADPLIVTGSVAFQSVGPRYEERTIGRRTMRLSRPGFSLTLHLVLIDGRTGTMIDSAALRPRVAYASTGRESALSLYFKLMEQAMLFVLDALGQKTTTTRLLLR